MLIAAPVGLDTSGGVDVVLHLHGHRAELTRTQASQHLLRMFAASGRDAVFVMPQGPVDAASGDFGKLMTPGGLEALLIDVVGTLYADGRVARPEVGELVITAHSGGYLAAGRILELGERDPVAVHLLDALYGYSATFAAYAERGGALRTTHTPAGFTRQNNLTLRARLRGSLGDALVEDLSELDVAVGAPAVLASEFPHNDCVFTERTYARLLATSGLAPSPDRAPELSAVTRSRGRVRVSWTDDVSAGAEVLVEQRVGGSGFEIAARVGGGASAEVTSDLDGMWRIRSSRLVARTRDGIAWWPEVVVSEPSDTYGAFGSSRWLVVDGFDRIVGSSHGGLTHDFGGRLALAIGSAEVVTNEAVARREVTLDGYDGVLWSLGDESRDDHTLEPAERAALDAAMAAGVRVVVSGAELGYATDEAWLARALGATYVSDDARTLEAGGYTFGVVYPEDYPDVLSCPDTLWTYSRGGQAACGRRGATLAVGFALETLSDDDLARAWAEIQRWVEP